MLDPATLDRMWAGEGQRRLARGVLRRPRFTEQGIELGAETVIAGAIRRSDGRAELDLDRDGQSALALLSVAYARPMGDWELRRLRAASGAWRKGDLSLAHIYLAHAGFGPLEDGETAPKRLYWAEKLLDWGMDPRELRAGLDLLPRGEPFGKASPDDPDHPGWPQGSPDGIGGQFRPKDDSADGAAAGSIGHNQGPPLDEPPRIPDVPPASRGAQFAIIRSALSWLKRAGIRPTSPATAIAAALATIGVAAGSWAYPYISAVFDRPKSLEELQDGVSNPQIGYDIHHIVEQGPARGKFPDDQIEDPDNLVRIPKIKHWELNAWYETKNPKLGKQTPRQYLQDKDWAERRRVGLMGMRDIGILAQ